MLDKKYNYKERDSFWEKYWLDKGTYEFNKYSNRPKFSVDTPPPSVSGTLHIGHICSYAQADMYIRYQRMSGKNVFFPMGFDNNGLPTEKIVEKDLKIRARDMERGEYIKKALEIVEKYVAEYKQTMMNFGISCDFNLKYDTIDEKSQKTSQKSFIELAKNGLAYRANTPAPWCCKCRCSIANAELEDQDLQSVFNYLNFKLADGSGTIPIATTRPEYLPACVAIFVNPEDERYKSFIGKKVKVPLFEENEVTVIADELVGIDKGAGVVMCCTFGDQTDVEWWKKYNLEYKQAIDDGGKMSEIAGKYAGLKITDARNAVIEDLKAQGYMFKQEPIVHAVKVHERCGEPSEILTKMQWFIKTSTPELIQKWIELGNQVKWHPANMQVRYNAWVENMNQDWSISRQRYFGIPFPVWYCEKCNKPHFAELKDLPVNPLITNFNGVCECGSTNFIPESDVLDTWATSALTPQINCNWFDDEQGSKEKMPMDVRFCARDIITTWDLRTIMKAYYHQNTLPWKNLMIAGWVMADKHNKISKSKCNAQMSLESLRDRFGSDVVRYWCSSGVYGRDVFLAEDGFKDGFRFSNKLWNACKFVYSFLYDYVPNKPKKILPMDEYIMQKFNIAYEKTLKLYENFEMGLAKEEMEKFFWDFCDNYIEIAKNRLYKPEVYGNDAKESAMWASYNVLFRMLQIFSITMPHITEELYQDYFVKFEKVESIHNTVLSPIPVERNEQIVQNGDKVVEVVSRVRQFKSEQKISLKTQIENVDIYTDCVDFMKSCEYDIKAVTGILNINLISSENFEIKFGNIIEEQN